jgi:hypothetical protein
MAGMRGDLHSLRETVERMADNMAGWQVRSHEHRIRALEQVVFRTRRPPRGR